MSRSDYTYERIKNIIAITDWNKGRMSVTNNIENVVEEISKAERISPTEYHWIYKDLSGLWDGWNPHTNTFILLNTPFLSDAKEQILYKK